MERCLQPRRSFRFGVPCRSYGASSILTVVGEQETDTVPYTTFVAAGVPGAESIQTTPNGGTGENDQFAAATTADGATWAVGWDINTSNHDPLILQSQNGVWSVVSSPSLGTGSDTGFAAITSTPGGGMWAVGVTAPAKGGGNYSTLIEYHP